MALPTNITELIQQWSRLLAVRTDDNNEEIAYKMVGILGGSDALWDEWYASGIEPDIELVFDTAANLELPDGITIKDTADRKAQWAIVTASIKRLEEKYLHAETSP